MQPLTFGIIAGEGERAMVETRIFGLGVRVVAVAVAVLMLAWMIR
jgi:hypothetical protein